MRVELNNLMPNIRELPISLKLDNKSEYSLPIKNDGYIINPKKYETEVENLEMDFSSIRELLLMMVKGDPNFINTLVKTDNNRFVNTIA